jgi:hypothetical protein
MGSRDSAKVIAVRGGARVRADQPLGSARVADFLNRVAPYGLSAL